MLESQQRIINMDDSEYGISIPEPYFMIIQGYVYLFGDDEYTGGLEDYHKEEQEVNLMCFSDAEDLDEFIKLSYNQLEELGITSVVMGVKPYDTKLYPTEVICNAYANWLLEESLLSEESSLEPEIVKNLRVFPSTGKTIKVYFTEENSEEHGYGLTMYCNGEKW